MTLVGIAAEVAAATRTALSQCEALQDLFGVDAEMDPVAALAALLFIGDAGEAQVEPYGLLTCRPLGAEPVAADLRRYRYELALEVWIPQPAETVGDAAEEDFLVALRLDEAATELWALHDADAINVELVSASSDQPVRDEEVGDGAGDLGNRLVIVVEAYND